MQLVAICGVPGAGKSCLASAVSERTGISIISKDVLMETLLNAERAPTHPSSAGPLAMQLALALIVAQRATHARLILDAPLWYQGAWDQIGRLHLRDHVRVIVIVCTAPSDVVLDRIAKRRSPHDRIRLGHEPMAAQEVEVRQREIERWSSSYRFPRLIVNTDANQRCVDDAVAFLEACFDR